MRTNNNAAEGKIMNDGTIKQNQSKAKHEILFG